MQPNMFTCSQSTRQAFLRAVINPRTRQTCWLTINWHFVDTTTVPELLTPAHSRVTVPAALQDIFRTPKSPNDTTFSNLPESCPELHHNGVIQVEVQWR